MKKAVFWYMPGQNPRCRTDSFRGSAYSAGGFLGQSRFGGTNPARSLFRGNLCFAGHRSGSKRTGGVRHFCAILIPEPDTGARRAAKSPFCPPLPPSAANIRRTESNAYSKDCPRHLPQHKGKAPVLPFLLRTGFRQRCFFHPL